jgi:P-type Ca2+ transporter type 2C
MGLRGTAVAREASAMVLQDDELSSIAEAITQGRTIYENIRKFVVYLFSCNISEALIVGLATLAGAPLPLLPLQILFLNLVTDVFPALALGVGPGSPALMQQPPRPAGEELLTKRHWLRILSYGLVLSATVLGAMGVAIYGLGNDADQAVTVSFCTLALAQLWHVFNMRSWSQAGEQNRRWFDSEITRNLWVWAALALCLVLVLGAVYVPPVSKLLQLSPPGAGEWALIIGMSLVPLLLGPAINAWIRLQVAQNK